MDKYTFYTTEPISNYKIPIFEKERNKDWVKYGEANDYPQYLCDLFNKSAKHNAILTAKQKYTFGRGIKLVDGLTSENAIKAQKMLINPNRFETLNDIFNKTELDKRLYGGYAVQIVWSKASEKIAEIYHMDFAKIRSNVDNTEFYYSDNWQDYRPKFATYKCFNPEKKEGVQILYYREYRPNLSTYPLPDYIGAIPYIESDVEVANFHRANLQNNFFFGGILNFNNGTPEPEEQRELVKRINARHQSSDNAGRWIINFSDGQDKAPNVIPIQPADLDKQFDILNKTIQQEIFVAHRVTSPMFMGIRVEGQLGGRNEIIDSFRLFQQNEIKPDQVHFEKLFNYLAGFNGVADPYRIEELEPFNPEFSEATLLEIATKDELREMAGLPVVELSESVKKLESLPTNIQDKIVNTLSNEELRGFVGLPVQMKMEFGDNWKDEIAIFSEFGDSVDNYDLFESRLVQAFEDLDEDVRKHTFEEHLEDLEQTLYQFVVSNTPEENKVLETVKKDPFISKKDLGFNVGLSPEKLDEVLKSLKDKSILTLTDGTWNILQVVPKKSAIKKIADEVDKFQVKYRYTGPQDSRNREFCAAMLDLNKLYTKQEIETISKRVGRDVWKRRGGWKTIKGTDIHVPFCRHTWAGILTRKNNMATVLFISEATLKAETIISENVDPKILIPTIKEAQYIYILPLFGAGLYNDLVLNVSASTLSSAYITLLNEYIAPCLIKYSVYECILPLSYKFQNKNIGQKSSDFSQQAQLNDLRYLLDFTKSRAEWYAERVSRFLLAYQATYPKYLTQENANASTIFPNSNNYQNGMFLGPDIDWDLIPPHIKYQGNGFRRN